MKVNRGLAEMLKGGVIMDVVNPEQAKIAEDSGATAVMALERVPADIRRDGGVARMSDPEMIEGIKAVVTIPVWPKLALVTLLRRRFSKHLVWTSLTSPKY
jgi:pyridoxal 5'-phosphate synthase pdxS subunit